MAAASQCAICGWNLFPHTPTGARNRHVFHTTKNKTLLFLELVTMFSTDGRPRLHRIPEIRWNNCGGRACQRRLPCKIGQKKNSRNVRNSSLNSLEPTASHGAAAHSAKISSGFRMKRLKNPKIAVVFRRFRIETVT